MYECSKRYRDYIDIEDVPMLLAMVGVPITKKRWRQGGCSGDMGHLKGYFKVDKVTVNYEISTSWDGPVVTWNDPLWGPRAAVIPLKEIR